MKKNKENKKQKKSDHAVETPPPPQVMDPSAPLQGVQEKKSNDTFQERKTSEEAKTEKLAPREEL